MSRTYGDFRAMMASLDAMLVRRLAGEPLQYVMSRWAFRHLDLFVDKRVLIPRPETELAVEHALSMLANLDVERDFEELVWQDANHVIVLGSRSTQSTLTKVQANGVDTEKDLLEPSTGTRPHLATGLTVADATARNSAV